MPSAKLMKRYQNSYKFSITIILIWRSDRRLAEGEIPVAEHTQT